MVESRFHEPEVLRFAELLSLAKRQSDLLRAEAILGKDSWGIDAMVSLPSYEESSHFPLFVAPSSLPRQYVVPYLCHPYVYFVNHEPLVRPWLKMGYIIIFDTNFASYVDKVVRGEPLKSQQDEVMRVIDDILYNDLNFDPTFYLVENIKKAYPIALGMKDNEISSPNRFWDLLDEGFRQNIVSLQLLGMSIICIIANYVSSSSILVTKKQSLVRLTSHTSSMHRPKVRSWLVFSFSYKK